MLFYCWSTPGNPHIRQTGLVSLPLSVSFPPLFLASPTPTPPFSFFLAPTQVILYLSQLSPPQLLNPSVILLSTQNQFGLVSGPKSLSVIYPVCVLRLPACLHPEWPHMKADHVVPDVLPQYSRQVKPAHSSLADCCCCCLSWVALQKESLN